MPILAWLVHIVANVWRNTAENRQNAIIDQFSSLMDYITHTFLDQGQIRH